MQPKGNVETWLGEVERRMKSSIRAQVTHAGDSFCTCVVLLCSSKKLTSWRANRTIAPSLAGQVMAAMATYGSKPRAQWACDWPAMVVLVVAQIFFSAGVEDAVASGAVPAYLERCTEDLMALTDLVRGWRHPTAWGDVVLASTQCSCGLGHATLCRYCILMFTKLHRLPWPPQVQRPLTDNQRQMLGALITIDVHARDVVAELVQSGEALARSCPP